MKTIPMTSQMTSVYWKARERVGGASWLSSPLLDALVFREEAGRLIR